MRERRVGGRGKERVSKEEKENGGGREENWSGGEENEF